MVGGGSTAPVDHDVLIETDRDADLRFVPDRVTAAGPGPRILFRNVSTQPHNLTFEGLEARSDTIVASGASQIIEVVAPRPGTYPFVCTIHPGMDGELTVT